MGAGKLTKKTKESASTEMYGKKNATNILNDECWVHGSKGVRSWMENIQQHFGTESDIAEENYTSQT